MNQRHAGAVENPPGKPNACRRRNPTRLWACSARLQSSLSCPRPFPPHLHTQLLALDSTSDASLPPGPAQFPSPASYCAGLGALSQWAVGLPTTEHSSFTHLSPPRWTSQARNLSVAPGTQLTRNTCWLRSELSNVYNARGLYRIQPL